MLCQNCRENKANVQYTQVINGEKMQMHLCAKCARKLGIDTDLFKIPSLNISNIFEDMFENEFRGFIPDFFSSSFMNDNLDRNLLEAQRIFDFDNEDTKEDEIDNILKNIQKKNKDKKEIINKPDKLEELKERLQKEIKEERYEDAAKTRDEIKREEEKYDK